jgi:hypothetical protein
MLQPVLGALDKAGHRLLPNQVASNYIPTNYIPNLPNLLYARYKSSRYAFLKRANNRLYWTTATRIYLYKSIHTSHLLLRQSESKDCPVETLLYRRYTRKQRKYYRTTKSS